MNIIPSVRVCYCCRVAVLDCINVIEVYIINWQLKVNQQNEF